MLKSFIKLRSTTAIIIVSIIVSMGVSACNNDDSNNDEEETEKEEEKEEETVEFNNTILEDYDGVVKAIETSNAITIDGLANDDVWATEPWYGMNYKWMGSTPDTIDYYGKFKLAWDSENLYMLVEVVDDVLNPTLQDGVNNYWRGDYVEVFVDENQSGGDHKFNHQAFAYHISTEGHAIDKNTAEETVFFDDHVDVVRTNESNTYLWEIALKLYDDTFDENGENTPVSILKGKKIGFSIAYGDNDGNKQRENFMGSKSSHGINNDEGYTNSSVFGELTFE
ncbi:MAG: sugar-binding protein [Bacteroidia bacterium]